MFGKLKQNIAQKELDDTRKKLIGAIDENINSSQQSIDDFCKILADFKKHKYSKHDAFLNLCIFSDIFYIDLTILLEKTSLANRIQEKKLFVRVIALTIVDYLDNINVLIGKDCLAEFKDNNMTLFVDEFKLIHKKFSTFRKLNDKVLRDIRNNTIAHKSKDALKLNKGINNLDIEQVYNFGLEFKQYSKEFIDLSTKVIYYIVDYMKEGRKI